MNDHDWFEIKDARGVEAVAKACLGAPTIGLDTESNSLHAYREKVCFVQIAARGRIYLIDTVRVRDLSALSAPFSDARTVKVIHGADYDVACLRRDFGLQIVELFDTMMAAQVLGYEQVGLGALLERHFQVPVDKSLAKYDWGRRPLDPVVLPYLLDDVRYLERLAYRMRDELRAMDRVEEARIEFARVAALEWNGADKNDPLAFRQMKGVRDLDTTGLAVLREIFAIRERHGEKSDVPVFRILGNDQLLEIAGRQPRSLSELRRIPGCTDRVIHRLGRELIDGVAIGLTQAHTIEESPKRRFSPGSFEDAELNDSLRAWRKEIVDRESKPSLVILPNHVLARIATQKPRTLEGLALIEGLGEKRLQRYGSMIIEVIEQQAAIPAGSETRRRGRLRSGQAGR